ncbi:MAG: hypothetical protein ACTHJR_01570 [Sphingomonas sp.]|uniref:hypothetical protein n=1 Tax=Sphingomonas sp. TaxID=28214 RepID=UPI003F7E3FEE
MSAIARQSPPCLHPETCRLLAADCWTADPAVAPLLSAIAALIPIGEQLRLLSTHRPSIDRLIADEIGSLDSVTIETGRLNIRQRDLRPNGVISLIWTELEALRSRWITARLAADGLDGDAIDIAPWYDRRQELEDEAPSLAQLWAATNRV